MKAFLKGVWITVLIGMTLAIASFHFRYQYLTIEDVQLNTPVLRDILLKNTVYRPIRFDRWTGKVEIYLGPLLWRDLAEWNQEKYQAVQTSLRQLTQAS